MAVRLAIEPSLAVIRAVGVAYARRRVKPLVIGVVVMSAALLVVGGWLIGNVSQWWWILEAVLIAWTALFLSAGVIMYAIFRAVEPTMDRQQRARTNAFVDKLDRVAGTLGISRFSLLFQVLRDTIRPSERGFLALTINDSKTLHVDFIALQAQFDKLQR